MQKFGFLITFILTASISSATLLAQDSAKSSGDVAQLLYKVNKGLLKQQTTISKAHKNLISAHENYVENPTQDTYNALIAAATSDTQAVKTYSQMVVDAKKEQIQIEAAEKEFYEETPVTNAEIEGSPPEAKGESVEKRLGESEQQIAKALTEEEGRGDSAFLNALKKQAGALKPLQDRIKTELNSPAVMVNPKAQNEDNELLSALNNAVSARLEVIFCANNSKKTCCKKYPSNPKCE